MILNENGGVISMMTEFGAPFLKEMALLNNLKKNSYPYWIFFPKKTESTGYDAVLSDEWIISSEMEFWSSKEDVD